MRQADVHETPTFFAIMHRAAEVCVPEGTEDGASALLARFEDRDEPVADPTVAEQEIAEAKGAVDPQDEDPVATMTAAVATYLAFRRTELDRDRAELLVLAARAGRGGARPPPGARTQDGGGGAPPPRRRFASPPGRPPAARGRAPGGRRGSRSACTRSRARPPPGRGRPGSPRAAGRRRRGRW